MTYDDRSKRTDDRKPRGNRGKPRDNDRGRGDRGSRDGKVRESGRRDGDGPNRGYRGKPRDNDRGRGDRGSRDGRDRGRGRADRGGRPPRRVEEPETPVVEEPVEVKLTIPSSPQKILFKGVDCEVNGKPDLAMVLYLHGAVAMSKGCESNAEKMLREMGRANFTSNRERIAGMCSRDALLEYDYLCWTLDNGYDRSELDSAAESGNCHALYCRIRLDEVEGEDPCIDTFASHMDLETEKVEEGLKRLKRREKSAKAEEHLKEGERKKKLRQSIRETFVRARNGDEDSLSRLESLSRSFPEAGFLRGYLDVYGGDGAETYLRDGFTGYRDTVLSMGPELGIYDTPFGMFIRAKRLQNDGEDWIPAMIRAAKAGSQEAMTELGPVQNRKDVRMSFASIYVETGDVENLVRSYDGEDTRYLDAYCSGDSARVLEVGSKMGGAREIDWLKRNQRNGVPGCSEALVKLAGIEERHCKQLVYALHDIGEEMEAAILYFKMYGDPTLPSTKWLAKVCADETANEYVRQRFEEMGDIATYNSIFIDDGYVRKHPGRGGPGRGGKGGKRRY